MPATQPIEAAPATRSLAEGGRTVALAGVAKFASGPGQSFFIAAFVDYLIRDAGVSRSGFATLYGLATVVSAAMVVGIGRLVDRQGIRRLWLAVAAGLASACLGLSLAAGPIMVFLALSLMRGFGQGAFPLLGTVLVATGFDSRRGTAYSVSAQGLTVAGIAMPAIAAALIVGVGWRSALQIVAVGLVVVILPLGFLVNRLPARGQRPEALPLVGLRRTLRRPGVLRLLLILAVPPLVSTAIVVNAVSVAGRSGLSPTAAAGALSAMALAGALGAAVAGQMADRLAPPALLASLGLTLAAGVGLLLAAAAPAALAGMVALGIATGMSATANGTIWASRYGTAGMGELQGVASAGQIAGAAAGPLPLAVLLALTGSYVPGLCVLLVLCVGATVAALSWRPRHGSSVADIQPGL